MSKTTNKYLPEVGERAVRMVLDGAGRMKAFGPPFVEFAEDRLCAANAERMD